MAEAARVNDVIKHSSKLLGWAAGAAAGAIIGAIVFSTGGLAAPVLAVAATSAVGAGAGLGLGALFDAFSELAGVKTGVLDAGSSSIEINGRAAVSILDGGNCCFPIIYQHYAKKVVEGSETVYFHCRPASRKGDALLCDAKIATGSSNVIIGGAAVRVKGTELTWFDTFLDYGSWYLTGLSFGVGGPVLSAALGAAANLGISSALSHGLNWLSQVSWVPWLDFGMSKAIGDGGNIADIYQIGADYYKYALKKVKYGGKINSFLGWKSHWKVQDMFKRQNVTIKSSDVALMGAGFAVDLIRTYRDVKRAGNIPETHEICCSDSTWLVPA